MIGSTLIFASTANELMRHELGSLSDSFPLTIGERLGALVDGKDDDE